MTTANAAESMPRDLLDALSVVDSVTTDRLHARLTEAAQRDGLLDVAYRTTDSPVGPLLIAATEQGLVRVAFAGQDHTAVLADLAERVSPRVLEAPARLDLVARELEEYFGRRRTAFDVALDFRLARGYRREVLSHLSDIRYGATASYAAVAAATGHPDAARAVGTACRVNPLPIVVPCHRVVRSDGSPGGYAGGADAKRILLDLESSLG
jgi:methylated-DNA-[protein]-cysteine S-methyltransferase